MSEKNLYRNSLTGMVEHLTDEQAAVFPKTLVQVPEGTKPYLRGMFTPGLVGDKPEPPAKADSPKPTGRAAAKAADEKE